MKLKSLLVILLAFTQFGSALAGPTATDPDAIVQSTSKKVIDIINNEAEALRQEPSKLNKLLDEVLLPLLDFRSFAKLTLGKNWRPATPEQREQFIREFKGMLLRTYTKYLIDYAGTKVTLLPRKGPRDGRRWTVNTEITIPGKRPLPVEYNFWLKNGQWKAYNVTVNGLSLVQLFREDFNREINQTSLDALINRLAQTNRNASAHNLEDPKSQP